MTDRNIVFFVFSRVVVRLSFTVNVVYSHVDVGTCVFVSEPVGYLKNVVWNGDATGRNQIDEIEDTEGDICH